MGISVIGGSGAGAEVFETLQHSSGTFTVDCSANKTVVLDVDDPYFIPSRGNLTYVGGASNAVALSASTTSVTISINGLSGGIASAPAAGDIVIFAFAFAADQNQSSTIGNGFTQIASLYSDGTTHDSRLTVAYKVMGSTPDGSVTITGNLFSDFSYAWAVQVWRNEDPTTPLDVSTVTATAINSSRANPPAITTVSNNSVVVAIGAGAFANTTALNYTTTDLSNFRTSAAQDTNSVVIGMGSALVSTPGTFDPVAFGGSATNSAASWTAVTLAIRPALNPTNTATINFSNILVEKKEITVNLSRPGSAPSAMPISWQSGIVGFSGDASLAPGGAVIEKFFTLGNVLYANAFASPAAIKKIDYFSSSGSWTAPAGVTYVNYTLVSGGGGGGGNVANTYATRGGASSFAGVTHEGGEAGTNGANGGSITADNAAANTGNGGGAGGTTSQASGTSGNAGGSSIPKTLGMAVTPGQSYAVVVGAGGAKGQPTGGNGGSGWVTVEYWMAG